MTTINDAGRPQHTPAWVDCLDGDLDAPDLNISCGTERGQINPEIVDGPVVLATTIAVGAP